MERRPISPLQWGRKHWGRKSRPTWPALFPGVPLSPARLHTASSQLHPSASSGPELKKKTIISKVVVGNHKIKRREMS